MESMGRCQATDGRAGALATSAGRPRGAVEQASAFIQNIVPYICLNLNPAVARLASKMTGERPGQGFLTPEVHLPILEDFNHGWTRIDTDSGDAGEGILTRIARIGANQESGF